MDKNSSQNTMSHESNQFVHVVVREKSSLPQPRLDNITVSRLCTKQLIEVAMHIMVTSQGQTLPQ